jgi:putative cell wall-binding protein
MSTVSHSVATRTLSLLLASGLAALLALVAPPALAAPASIHRLAGDDRYATAAAVSRDNFAAGVGTVYIANGLDYPDALAGAPRAAADGSPILLVQQTALPSVVKTELNRLRPGRIVILGGPGVVSDAVANELGAYASGGVSRLSGADRYATAAAVASTFGGGVDVAYVASGLTYPDALAGAPVAGSGQDPVLLVRGDRLDAPVAGALGKLRPKRIVILGGTGAVSESIAAELRSYTAGSVSRLGGNDRFSTSAAISAAVYPDGSDVVYLANGYDFPDALSAAPLAGRERGPVLLVRPGSIDPTVALELARLGATRVVALGGPGVVTDAVLNQAAGRVPDPIMADKPVVNAPDATDEMAKIAASYRAPAASSAGAVAMKWARTQIGKPYGWGDEGPDSYDCSGLTMWAFGKAGKSLPRVTRDQWKATTRVALADMRPGDLMFWSRDGQPSGIYHVAIFTGNGMRLHAPVPDKFVEEVGIYNVNLLPFGGRVM